MDYLLGSTAKPVKGNVKSVRIARAVAGWDCRYRAEAIVELALIDLLTHRVPTVLRIENPVAFPTSFPSLLSSSNLARAIVTAPLAGTLAVRVKIP